MDLRGLLLSGGRKSLGGEGRKGEPRYKVERKEEGMGGDWRGKRRGREGGQVEFGRGRGR